jgi:nitrogen-specific signal transduction histidine kinase
VEADQPRNLAAACEAVNGLAHLFTRLAAAGLPGEAPNAAALSASAIGEIFVSEGGDVSVAWLTGAGIFASGTQPLKAWHAKAVRRPGRFVAEPADDGAKGAGWCGLLSWPSQNTEIRLAFFMRGAGVPASSEAAIGALLNILSMLVARRRERIDPLPRLQLSNERDLAPSAWLSMAADILWEANADGVLRCRRVLNGRADAARLLDGINLGLLRSDAGDSVLDLLKRDGCVRNLRAGEAGARDAFFFNAETHPVGDAHLRLGFRGTASAAPVDAPVAEAAATAIALSREIRRNADRERQTSENILRGLRLLLEPGMWDGKLVRMAEFMAQDMGCAELRVVQWRAGARAPVMAAPGDAPARACDPALYAALDAALEGRDSVFFESDDAASWPLRSGLGLTRHALLVRALPAPRGPAFLVCGTREPGGFDGATRGTIERFALLLRHCLAMGDAADECVRAAKMAGIGHMAAAAMHEIFRPLSTIAMVAQNLERIAAHDPIDAEIVRKKSERLMGQVARAARVADRLNRFGRMSANRETHVALRRAVDDAADLLAPAFSAADIRLVAEIPDGLGVLVDAAQLEHILVNLLQNALAALDGVGSAAHNPEGAVRITASACASASGAPEILIRIEDDGAGFPRAMLNRVSRAFFTTKPEGEGAGLGLAICEILARDNGGALEFGTQATGAFAALRLRRAGAPS